jgi:hypothetical protein
MGRVGGGGGTATTAAASVLLILLLHLPGHQDGGGGVAAVISGGGQGPDDGSSGSSGSGQPSPCEFPSRWRGEFFQGGLREVFHVTTQNFGPEGLCYRAHADGTFIIFNRSEKCYKCLRVWERHRNVLEYQLGRCRKYESPGEDFCAIEETAPYR